MRKLFCIFLALALIAALAGCSAAGDIANKVAQAAMEELKVQVQATFEKNKIEVLQVKSALGKLNDDGGKLQLYLAFLVRSENPQQIQSTADALSKVGTAGFAPQLGTKVESPYLTHKEISFDADKLTDPTNCYLVYLYIPEFSVDLPEITLPSLNIPGLG